MGTMEEENKAFMRHMFDLVNKEKTAAVCLDFCDSNYVEHRYEGELSLEEAKQEMLDFPQFTDYSLTVDHLLADGDKVAYSVTHRYTQGATGKKIKMTSTCIVRIANGKMMENWVLGDRLNVFQQLGFLPSTEEILKNAQDNAN